MPDPFVYLCYAREDADIVDRFAAVLDAHEPPVPWFIDRHSIKPGQDYPDALDAALRGSALLVVLLTHRSVTKPGVLDEFAKARRLGKAVAKIALADPREFVGTPMISGEEATAQLITGSLSDPPSDADLALFAAAVGGALGDACRVRGLLRELEPHRRKTRQAEAAETLVSLGQIVLRPTLTEMELVLDAARSREEAGEDGLKQAQVEHLYRLASVLANVTVSVLERRAETGDGISIHPETLDQPRIAHALASTLEFAHHTGTWWFRLEIAEAAALLDRAAAAPAFHRLADHEDEWASRPFPDTWLALLACGVESALPPLMALVRGETDGSTGERLEAAARRALIQGLVAVGPRAAARALRAWVESGRAKIYADQAGDAADQIEARAEGRSTAALSPRTLWLADTSAERSVSYSGVVFTKSDALLALRLFETGHLVVERRSWFGVSLPTKLADLRPGTKYGLFHTGLDGVRYELGPKEVFRLVEIMLTGTGGRPVGGGDVNAPFIALGFDGRWE